MPDQDKRECGIVNNQLDLSAVNFAGKRGEIVSEILRPFCVEKLICLFAYTKRHMPFVVQLGRCIQPFDVLIYRLATAPTFGEHMPPGTRVSVENPPLYIQRISMVTDDGGIDTDIAYVSHFEYLTSAENCFA
jgi:hypothetical protein